MDMQYKQVPLSAEQLDELRRSVTNEGFVLNYEAAMSVIETLELKAENNG